MLGYVLVRATDRDLKSVTASFCVNAWTCPRPATDHDLANVTFNKFCNICDVCNVCNFHADVLFSN